MSILRPLAIALLLVLVACSSPPPPPAPKAAAVDVAAEARRAFARRDWPTAAPLLRQALGVDPASLQLHFYLAITASYLELREEAIREFLWVLNNARAGSEEHETARRWLADAGVTASANAADKADDGTVGDSGIRGQVIPPGSPGAISAARLQLFLKGIMGTPTEGLQYVLRTGEDGRFEFKKIPPGTYKLTNVIAGRPAWRLRVTLPPGQPLTLDLTPQNSFERRDDFPQEPS